MDLKRILPILIIAITAVGAVVWNLHSPEIVDDWCYKLMPIEGDQEYFWDCMGRPVETFADALESIRIHVVLINARLTNVIHTLFVPFDRNIELVVNALFIGLMALLIALAGDCRRRLTTWSAMVATAAMWYYLPWYDFMLSADFQVNYVWTTVMVLGLLLLLPRLPRMGGAAFAATCLLALVTGMMHEGFTVILIVYLAFSAVFDRQWRYGRFYTIVALLVVAVALHLCGGITNRVDVQSTIFDYRDLSRRLSRILASVVPMIISFALLLVLKIRKKTAWREIARRYGAGVAAICAGAAMPVVLMMFDRVFWPMDLFCVLMTVNIATELLDGVGAKAVTAAGVIFGVIYAAWFVSLVKWQKRICAEYLATVSFFESRKDSGKEFCSIVPLDVVRNDEMPFWLMDIVPQAFESNWAQEELSCYFRDSTVAGDPGVMPLPPEIAGKPFDQWPRIPGDNDIRGVWPFVARADSTLCLFRATLGAPTSNMPPADRLLTAAMGRGGEREHYFIWWPIRLVTADGTVVWRIYLDRMPRTMRHRPLVRVDYAGEIGGQ